MDSRRPPVKRTRSYDSLRRREQARETRAAIVRAARHRFLRDGFAATTIAAIGPQARRSPGTSPEAPVAVAPRYRASAGKPGLVRSICELALAGEGPVPAEVRSDALQATG